MRLVRPLTRYCTVQVFFPATERRRVSPLTFRSRYSASLSDKGRSDRMKGSVRNNVAILTSLACSRRRNGDNSIDIARHFTTAREHDLARASDRKANVVNELLSNRVVQRSAVFFRRKSLGPVRNQQVSGSSPLAGSIRLRSSRANASAEFRRSAGAKEIAGSKIPL